jgi:hypothetical protein
VQRRSAAGLQIGLVPHDPDLAAGPALLKRMRIGQTPAA